MHVMSSGRSDYFCLKINKLISILEKLEMSDKLILYNVNFSPPVRSVKIIGQLLGLDFDLRDINLFYGEQFQESFIKVVQILTRNSKLY